ncbi:MAG: Fe-S cluster assembly protein SufB, partial [bacterium]
MTTAPESIVSDYKFGFFDEEEALFKAKKGINADIVNMISDMKDEPQWMRDFRLRSLELFLKNDHDPAWASPVL